MRIAVNQPRSSYFVGGSEVVSFEHVSALVEAGEDVTFYTINPTSISMPASDRYVYFKDKYASRHNLKIIELTQDEHALPIYSTEPGENKERWYTESMFYNRALFEAINDPNTTPYDILLSYYQFDALCIPSKKVARNALYLSGIPSTENSIRSSQLKMYDKVIAITDDVGYYWQKYDKRPIPTVPTGVHLYDPKLIQHKPSNRISIVFAGRLIERKGCANLIQAVSTLPLDIKKRTNVKILGEGPQRDALEKAVKSAGLNSSVQFVGLVNNPKDYFAQSDICVFPSLRGEGLMGVVLEAMSANACVVSTRQNGNDLLLDNNRGVLIEPGDITELAKSLEVLALDQKQRVAIGSLARKYVKKYHGWDKIITDLIDAISR